MSEYVFTKDELAHHGIKGQKWGQRRFQNPDGSYTPEGLERYGRSTKNQNGENSLKRGSNKKNKVLSTLKDPKVQKALKVGAAVAGTALAAYGAYKAYEFINNKSEVIQRGRLALAIETEQKYINAYNDSKRLSNMVSDPSTKDRLTKEANWNKAQGAQAMYNRNYVGNKYNKSSSIERIKDSYNLLSANKKQTGKSFKESYDSYKKILDRNPKAVDELYPLIKKKKR